MLNNISIALVAIFVLAIGFSNAESCISCNSKNFEDCAQRPQNIMAKTCLSNDKNTSCYTRIVDENTIRGCSDEMDADVFAKCSFDPQNCTICRNINDNVGCNNHVFPAHRLTCHICSGDNCTNTVEGNPTPCKNYQEQDRCFIRKSKTSFERGCLSDSEKKCANLSHCFTCDGHGCNLLNGNDTSIPLAPSSAHMPKTTIFSVLLITFIGVKIFS